MDRRRLILLRASRAIASYGRTGAVPVRIDCKRAMRLQASESDLTDEPGLTRATFTPCIDTPITRRGARSWLIADGFFMLTTIAYWILARIETAVKLTILRFTRPLRTIRPLPVIVMRSVVEGSKGRVTEMTIIVAISASLVVTALLVMRILIVTAELLAILHSRRLAGHTPSRWRPIHMGIRTMPWRLTRMKLRSLGVNQGPTPLIMKCLNTHLP